MAAGSGRPGIRVWDAPTRLGHWALAALVAFAWWSAEYDHMDWHLWAGYGVLFVIAFRLYWGLVGSQTARFSHFLRGPRTMLAYARTLVSRKNDHGVGHNPLGALSVVALLLTLAVQIVTGLFAVDIDGVESGRCRIASISTRGGALRSGTIGASPRSKYWWSCIWR